MERKIKDMKTKSYLYDVNLLDPCRKQRFPVIFSIIVIVIVLCFKEVLCIIKNFSDYTWQHLLYALPSPFSSLYLPDDNAPYIYIHQSFNHSGLFHFKLVSKHKRNCRNITPIFLFLFFFFFLLTNSSTVLVCIWEERKKCTN